MAKWDMSRLNEMARQLMRERGIDFYAAKAELARRGGRVSAARRASVDKAKQLVQARQDSVSAPVAEPQLVQPDFFLPKSSSARARFLLKCAWGLDDKSEKGWMKVRDHLRKAYPDLRNIAASKLEELKKTDPTLRLFLRKRGINELLVAAPKAQSSGIGGLGSMVDDLRDMEDRFRQYENTANRQADDYAKMYDDLRNAKAKFDADMKNLWNEPAPKPSSAGGARPSSQPGIRQAMKIKTRVPSMKPHLAVAAAALAGAGALGVHGLNKRRGKGKPAITMPKAAEADMGQVFDAAMAAGAGYMLGVRACGRDMADAVFDEVIKCAEDAAAQRPVSSIEYKIRMIKDLVSRLRNKQDGVVEKVAADDPIAMGFDKMAQALEGADTSSLLNKYLYKPLLGESTAGQVAGTVADVGTYFVPYLGPARAGWDAVTDYTNMFGKNLSLGERARYLASGLGNTIWAGSGLLGDAIIPGLGSVTTGAIGKGIKWLTKFIPGGQKVVPAINRGAAAIDASRAGQKVIGAQTAMQQGLRNWGTAGNPLQKGTAWMMQATKNPWANTQGIAQRMYGGGAQPAASAWQAAKNTAGYFGYGAPRQLLPIAAISARPTMPTAEDYQRMYSVPPPQAAVTPMLYGGSQAMRSPVVS